MEDFRIQTGNKTIIFFNKVDYDNYNDYLQNGLKVIRKSGYTYHFNNGDTFTNIPSINGYNPVQVLRSGNKEYKQEKYFKKHLQLIGGIK